MKTCNQCNIEKALTEFYAHPRNKDGVDGKCKECAKAATAANQARKSLDPVWFEKELQRHRDKARRMRAEGRVSYGLEVKLAKRKWAKQNKHKRDAHCAVSNAVRDGRLQKKPCEVCGAEKSQAHHDDYSKALDVRWLCIQHHNEHHIEERRHKRMFPSFRKESN